MNFRALVFLASFIQAGLVFAQTPVGDFQAPGRVRQAVEKAKASGLKDVTLIPIPGLPTGITDLDGAIANHSILVVRLVGKVTTMGHPDHLMTWYKAEVEEVIGKQKAVSSDPVPEIPAQFRQIGPNEILLPTQGGSLIIDGVSVHETSPINSLLALNSRYLICVDLRHEGQVGTLFAELDGLLLIKPEGTLKPLGNVSDGIVRDIHERFADDLEFVRSYVREQSQ
jgi:hypothetical protein